MDINDKYDGAKELFKALGEREPAFKPYEPKKKGRPRKEEVEEPLGEAYRKGPSKAIETFESVHKQYMQVRTNWFRLFEDLEELHWRVEALKSRIRDKLDDGDDEALEKMLEDYEKYTLED